MNSSYAKDGSVVSFSGQIRGIITGIGVDEIYVKVVDRTDDTTGYKTVDTVKIDYDGKMVKQTNNAFTINNIEGLNVHALAVDNSGDVYPMGQTSWNRNCLLYTSPSPRDRG